LRARFARAKNEHSCWKPVAENETTNRCRLRHAGVWCPGLPSRAAHWLQATRPPAATLFLEPGTRRAPSVRWHFRPIARTCLLSTKTTRGVASLDSLHRPPPRGLCRIALLPAGGVLGGVSSLDDRGMTFGAPPQMSNIAQTRADRTRTVPVLFSSDPGDERERHQRKPASQPAVSFHVADRTRGGSRRSGHRQLDGNFGLCPYSPNQERARSVSTWPVSSWPGRPGFGVVVQCRAEALRSLIPVQGTSSYPDSRRRKPCWSGWQPEAPRTASAPAWHSPRSENRFCHAIIWAGGCGRVPCFVFGPAPPGFTSR